MLIQQPRFYQLDNEWMTRTGRSWYGDVDLVPFILLTHFLDIEVPLQVIDVPFLILSSLT